MPSPRTVHAYVRPPVADEVAGRTLIVVDTLRATTVITTLIAGGADAVYPCPSLDEARTLAQTMPGAKLCGERGGLPPEGFDFGNSAVEFAQRDVAGWTVVQSTSNGSRALTLAREAEQTLVGCLRNRDAVARAALRFEADIAVVCSGDHEGRRASVEDTFTAGAYVERLLELEPGLATASGARLARRIFQAYGRSGETAFHDAPHAATLRKLGFRQDLVFAARIDVESCVPRAAIEAGGRIRISAG